MAESNLSQASRTVRICNRLGLHMRPVMQFVDLAGQYQSRITVSKGDHCVDGKSPMEMMLLEAVKDSELEIQAEGSDAAQAVDALVELVEKGFGED